GYGLTRDDMRLFWDMYLQAPGDVTHPYASPLEAKSLGGLPPALILIAEFDPLADEAEAYAGKLRGADVAAHVIRYPGMIHGFIEYLGGVDAAHVAVADCAAALRTAMGELPTAT
ncbi:MAG TPA: alpha/beta hydrolase fold domain-containing protein, partial [Candidatus Dormibacteraeota bacterium]|nr:alpha/beta hydrolase fold domain-containing protein [Candidatus Dormibacteraeota bacterium]